MIPRAQSLARTAIKILITATLLAFAARGVDLFVVRAQIANTDAYDIAAAAALITGISLIHAERWRIILARLHDKLAYGQALRLVLIGYFFNQTLPSTVGGDVFRIWGAYRGGIPLDRAASSVVVDRAMALCSLLLMIAASVPWLFDLFKPASIRWVVILLIAGGILGIAFLCSLGRYSGALGRGRLGRIVLLTATGLRDVLSSLKTAAIALALTVLGYLVLSCAVCLLARGMSIDLTFGDALLLIPLVTLVTIMPISIAGWGLREGAMVAGLGLIGISATAAFSLSVLYGLVTMASGVPGGLAWLFTPHEPASVVAAQVKGTLKS